MGSAFKGLPLVSIVAVCYNHAKYLVETLDSIKKQTYQNIELIIMDDHSTDNSVEIIRDWIKSTNYPCVFVAHTENRGLCSTINEALDLCSGVYFQTIACDDILIADKISKQVAVFDRCPGIALVCSNYEEIDEEGIVITKQGFCDGFQLPSDVTMAILDGERIFIHTPTVLLLRSVFREVGKYREDIAQEDYDMWLKITSRFQVKYIPDVTVKYRVLSNSLSRDVAKFDRRRIDNLKVLKDFCAFNSKYKQKIEGIFLGEIKYFINRPTCNAVDIAEAVELFFKYSTREAKQDPSIIYRLEELLIELLLIDKDRVLSILEMYEYSVSRKKYRIFFEPWMPNFILKFLMRVKSIL